MKSKFTATVVSTIFTVIARLFYFSYRFKFHGMENIRAAEEKSKNYIYSFWHQDIFACMQSQTGRNYVVMISQNRSADPIATACKSLGHTVVRGSSAKGGRDKGGKAAKNNMTEVLLSGLSGAVVADGPTGPFHKVKAGIINMAQDTGYPIIPLTAIASRNWQFNTWDKSRLPKPFAKIDVYYGAPIYAKPELNTEEFAAIQEQVAEATIALETQHNSQLVKPT